jgi:hypothetical protein
MADDGFLKSLVKKALVSAASAAGSKVGGAAAAYVLDILGLGGNNDLDEIKAELDSISDQVKKTDSKISVLMDEIKWAHATDSFDNICAAITTHNDNIQTLLAITDTATRDAQIKQYVLTAHPPLDELDTSLTLIDNRLMGKSGGITGVYTAPLMKTYLDTHWDVVWDKSIAKTYQTILGVYLQSAQMQRLATTLLVAYREASNQPQLAQSAREHIETRLAAQFQVMAQAMPDFLALNALTAPGLQMNFTGLQIAPNYVSVDNGRLIPSSAPTSYGYWQLSRTTADPTTPNYRLSIVGAVTVTELVTQIPVNEYDVGFGAHTITHYDYETAHLLSLAAGTSNALIFSIEATDQQDVLRLKIADGRTLGYINRYYSGYTFELTNTEATTSNGLVTCTNIIKIPYAPQPTLSAWSRTFSNTPQGEGRFQPGYRVRYRVTSINRFGESTKSDWLLAPKPEDSQDSDGYFGNQNLYFPQISLFDSTGRTEGYRIFRQFHGGNEEEVTAGGTFTGEPQSGNPVIFDDFTL